MINWITTAMSRWVWWQFVSGPLYLVSGFNSVLYYLSGGIIWDLLFGGKKTFSWSNIPTAFWGFCILAAALVCIVFLIQYIVLLFGENKDMKHKILHAVKMTGFACVFVFFIPIGYFMLNQIVNFVASELGSIFGVKDINIAGMVWNIGNPDWNGKDIYTGDFFTSPDNISSYNMVAEIFGTWFILFAIIMLGLALVQKIFELFFLFIIGAVVGSTMTIDSGKRMIIWKDYVIAKSLASLGTIIAYYVFMVGIGALLGGGLGGFTGAERQILMILLICGGAISCMTISNIIASFVGEGVGIREGLASISSTMAAAKLTMGAGKVVGKAIGFGKNKKGAMQAQGGMNPIQQGADAFKSENGGSNSVADESPFKIPNNGLRAHTGLAWVAGTALALGSASVFAFSKGASKSWKNTKGEGTYNRIGKAVTHGSLSTIGHPFKVAGKAIGRGAKNTTQKIKQNTHGVYKEKEKQHTKSKDGKKQETGI